MLGMRGEAVVRNFVRVEEGARRTVVCSQGAREVRLLLGLSAVEVALLAEWNDCNQQVLVGEEGEVRSRGSAKVGLRAGRRMVVAPYVPHGPNRRLASWVVAAEAVVQAWPEPLAEGAQHWRTSRRPVTGAAQRSVDVVVKGLSGVSAPAGSQLSPHLFWAQVEVEGLGRVGMLV